MTSKLMNVSITSIDANPWRNLSKYPFVESKVDALVRSIKDVGLWEGIIVRKVGSRYQLAFGHHRWKAAKKARLTKIPVIVRTLTDKQMLQFMGRENLEDWNADFACMYEAWEAVRGYEIGHGRLDVENVEIARTLGWTEGKAKNSNNTARACASAQHLIELDRLSLDDLRGQSVKDVRELCGHMLKRLKEVERVGQQKAMPKSEITRAQKQVERGVKDTIKQLNKQDVTTKQIRSQIDVNTWSQARKAKKRPLLFEQFGKNVANAIEKMLNGDPTSERLDQIIEVVSGVTEKEDARIIARIRMELEYLEGRTIEYGKAVDREVKGKAGKVIRLERKQLAEVG